MTHHDARDAPNDGDAAASVTPNRLRLRGNDARDTDDTESPGRSGQATARPIYTVRLRPQPGVDAVRALRAALKVLLRRFGLRAIEVKEEP